MSSSEPPRRRALARVVAFLLAAAAVLECGPPETASGDAWVIADEGGRHQLVKRPMPAGNLVRLESDAFHGIYRPTVVTRGTVTIEGGTTPALDLVLKDGAWLPTLYEHLVALSAFHHFHAARDYYLSIGGARLAGLPRYDLALFPELPGDDSPSDNAFFAPKDDGGLVAILPELLFRRVPIAADQGVVTHELGHAVFAFLRPDLTGAKTFELAAVNEGVADVHAAALLDRPDFFDEVFPEGFGEARRLDRFRVLDDGTVTKLTSIYSLGSILAGTFWAFRTRLSARMPSAVASRRMGELALVATATMTPVRALYTYGILEAAVRATTPEERLDLCAEIASRMPTAMDDISCAP